MKLNRLVTVSMALLMLTLCGHWSDAAAQRSSKTKLVNVYFPKDGESTDPKKNPWNLQPVRRTVSAAAPLRQAIEALLKGPTAKEERQGFGALDARGLYIIKVAIKGQTAYASFGHRKSWLGWSGDLSPFSFDDAVKQTMGQFPNVSRAIVCVDGITNYGDESGGPAKRCPKF